MANIPLQYPFPYKTINSTGFTSSVEFVNVTVLGDVTIDQNLTVSGNITTTDLTVGDDLTVGGQIDAQVLRAFGIWDTPIPTVNGAGAWIGYDASGHTIFANRKATAGQTNSWRWYAFDETNAFQGELMRLSNAGNLFISGTRIEFPLIHFQQPPGTFPQYDFILPSSMGGAGQVLTSAGAGSPTYWTTPSGGGGGGGTVTNVTGTSPISVTSPTTTPNISLGTVPTTLGGTGLTTVGTNGQVLSSNGTTLQYVTLPTPVTSVSATSPLASSGGATPTISISSSTGTGAVVLQDDPLITTGLTIAGTTYSAGYIRSGTVGVGSGSNISDLFLTQVGLGGGYVNQYIRAAYTASNGYYISINPGSDFISNGLRNLFPNDVLIGGFSGTSRLSIGDGSMDGGRYGSVQITQDFTTIINSSNIVAAAAFVSSGNYVWDLGYAQGTNTFGFGLGATSNFSPSRLSITDAGNVGINTTTPAAKLHVVSSGSNGDPIRVTNTTPSGATFIQYQNDIRTWYAGAGGSTSEWADKFLLAPSGTASEAFVQTNIGNIGIGTIAPAQKLHVSGGRFRLSDSVDSVIEIFAASYQNYLYTTSSNGNFIIDTTGRNVGINTASPTSNLHVNGTVRATNFTTNGTALFQYTEGSFTPRLGAWRRATNVLYELTNVSPVPNATITATYSTQSGYFSRIGKMLTYNCEVRWTISTGGLAPDDYDIVIILPDGYNPNTSAVVGPCLNYPNTISSISNPMGTIVYLANFSGGGQKPIICPTTGTGQIAYPIFAPGGTQVLTFSASYPVN